MELHLHLPHYWRHHRTDWVAAAVSGLAAGAVLMLVELLWAALVSGDSPWRTSHAIAAIALGSDALQSAGFGLGVVSLALALHYLLGVAFGLLLGWAIAPFLADWGDESWSLCALFGTLFGALLYLLNFYGMAQIFPWFAALRGAPAFVAHLIFGASAALIYWKLERRSMDQ